MSQAGLSTVLTGSFTFDLDPGESVTVYANAWSQMFGENGIADASTTLDVGFSAGPLGDLIRSGDPTTAIPEPGFFGLLLGAAGMLFLFVRRQR